MRIDNVHERVVAGGPDEIAPLLATLGQLDDALYPLHWNPMRYDGPIAVGARGSHGIVTAYEPGRLLEFTFPPGMGITGTHTFTVTPLAQGRARVRHVVDADATAAAWLAWHAVIRPSHDAVLEELLDRLATATGTPPARPAVLSRYARLLRWFERPRVRATDVPYDGLVATALPRIDFADAFAVDRRREARADPQAWAAAIFDDLPGWVTALAAVRELLVGLVGIDRGGDDAFAEFARDGDEVLVGIDADHLDFRASVRCEPERVVLTTVVHLHNLRGRAYFAVIRPIHPLVVRAMLRRAAVQLARKSNARPVRIARMDA